MRRAKKCIRNSGEFDKLWDTGENGSMDEQNKSIMLVLAAFVVAVLGWAGYSYLTRNKSENGGIEAQPTRTYTMEEEKKVEEKTKITVPDEGIKAILKDDKGEALAVAVKVKTANGYQVSVTANLLDPDKGTFYQAWLIKGDDRLSLGKLTFEKAGYIVGKSFTSDVSGYTQVIVSRENKLDDTMEEKILEGTFQE